MGRGLTIGLLVLAVGCGAGQEEFLPTSTSITESSPLQATASIASTGLKREETRPPDGFALVLSSGKTIHFYDFGTEREATTELSPEYSLVRYEQSLFAVGGGARLDDYVSEYWLLPAPGDAVKLPLQEGLTVGPSGEIWGWVVGEAAPAGFRLSSAMSKDGRVERSFFVPVNAKGPLPIKGGAVVEVDGKIYLLDAKAGTVQLVAFGQLHGVVGDRFDWTECAEGRACTRFLSSADRHDESASTTNDLPTMRSDSPDRTKYIKWIAYTGTFEVHDTRSEQRTLLSYHYGTMCGSTDWSPDSVWFVVFDCKQSVLAINTVTGLQYHLDIARFGTIDNLKATTVALPPSWFDPAPSPWSLPTPTIARRLPNEPCPPDSECSTPRAA